MTDSGRTSLLLARTIHPGKPDEEAGRTAGEQADQVVQLSRRHRVTALLARAWERAGVLGSLSPDVRHSLRAELLEKAHDRGLLEEDCRTAAAALNAALIPFLALKGTALGVLAYPDPNLRPMTDVDLLVFPPEKERALQVLSQAGFKLPSPADQEVWSAAYYNLPVESPADHRGSLEVHWSIAQSGRHRPDIPGIFNRRRLALVLGEPVGVPGAADLLLHQALHLSYHYFEPKLIWLYDIALLLADPPPAEEVIGRAGEWGMAVPLALALAQADKAFPGCLPPAYEQFVQGSRRARWIVTRWGGKDPLALISGWRRRRTQLALGLLMLDSPTQVARTAAGYLSRRLRFGDLVGHRLADKKKPGP